MTVACLLPPIRRPSASKYRNQLKKTHCYKIRHIKEEKLKFRRLGSGFLPPLLPDTLILDHLLLRMPTLLLDQKEVPSQLIEADFGDAEERSQKSGSFKGTKLSQRQAKDKGSPLGVVGLSSARDKDGASSASSTLPVLPPIGQTYSMLTPIGEASREHTQHTQALSLQQPLTDADSMMPQVNVLPSTPQHSMLSNPPTTQTGSNMLSQKESADDEEEGWAGHQVTEREILTRSQRDAEEKHRKEFERRRAKVSQHSLDLEGPMVKGGAALMSSSESLEPGSSHSLGSGFQPTVHRQPWKGSTQSLRSHGSRQHSGSGGLDDRASGSVVLGPEGELINVGGTIRPHMRPSDAVQDIHDANIVPGLRDVSDDSDTEMPDAWRDKQSTARKPESHKNFGNKRGTPKSQISEQDIIDTIASHASRIAKSVLSQSDTGQVLEDDIRTVIQEVMKSQKRNSAGPTVAEYRDQIRENLITTIAKLAGIDQSEIPADAEIDPQLIDDLAHNRLSPDDIEIVKDEISGRSFIKSRNRKIEEAMGGIEKGHLYYGADKGHRISIPSERAQQADIGELDVIHYKAGGDEESDKQSQKTASVKAGSVKGQSERAPSEKTPSIKAKTESERGKSPAKSLAEDASLAGKSGVSFKDEVEKQEVDDFQKALASLERPPSEPKKSDTDVVSVKSGKSGESQKSDDKKSKVSSKKATTPDKKEEFVVGKVHDKKELEELYGQPVDVPPPKPDQLGKPKEKKKAAPPAGPKKEGKKPKKGGKKGKKKEEVAEPPTAVEEVPKEATPKPETPPPVKETTPKPPTPAESYREESPEFVQTEEEDEEDFIIIRDQTPSPEPEIISQAPTAPSPEEEIDEEQYIEENEEEMVSRESESEADKLRMISNREARAAKRAAAAEKRKQEVERKRREREEELKKQKEEQERQEKLKAELEDQRRRKEEERRLKKQREADEMAEQERERIELEKRKLAEMEREKKMKEDYARKLEDMKKKQAEEEKKRKEEAERRAREEEERRLEEEALMATMAEQERLDYERKKREEEEERIRKEEEEKRRREEEAQRALEEARRLAEEMARKQAELEARLKFNKTLHLESNGLNHTQDINKAFVFSYFELLTWLGLDIPEFELLKLNQY